MTLFATHYHELTHLSESLPSLACYTMRVREWRGDVLFLHEVTSGTADRSYGIHVAKLAGLPTPVLHRARHVLKMLESDAASPVKSLTASALPLFNLPTMQKDKPPAAAVTVHPLIARLAALDVDSLTARDALALLYELKSEVDIYSALTLP